MNKLTSEHINVSEEQQKGRSKYHYRIYGLNLAFDNTQKGWQLQVKRIKKECLCELLFIGEDGLPRIAANWTLLVTSLSKLYLSKQSLGWKAIRNNILEDDLSDKDLIHILSEYVCDDLLNNPIPEVKEEDETPPEVPAEIQAQAEQLLQSPNLLHIILTDMGTWIVGEEKTALQCFLQEISCQSPRDYSFTIVAGDSSTGKTYVVQNTLEYLPPKWWRKVGRLSRTALEYLQDQDFDLLWIQERRGGKEASESIRLSSVEDGGTEVWVTGRNPETGQLETQIYTVPGRAIITTTVHTNIDTQDLTRSWLINVDESEEQTQRILDQQGDDAKEPRELRDVLGIIKEDLRPVVREALNRIRWDYVVIIPYSTELSPLVSTKVVRSRRDLKKLYRLIRVITILHQRMRPQFQIGDQQFLVSEPQDAYIAAVIAGDIYQKTALGLDEREKTVLEELRKQSPLTRQDVGRRCDRSATWAYDRLASLIDKGYVDVEKSGKAHEYMIRQESIPDLSQTVVDRIDFPVLEDKVKEFLNAKCRAATPDRKHSVFEYWDPMTGKIQGVPPPGVTERQLEAGHGDTPTPEPGKAPLSKTVSDSLPEFFDQIRCSSCGEYFPSNSLGPGPSDQQGVYCPDCINKLTPAPPPAPTDKKEPEQEPSPPKLVEAAEDPPSEIIRTSRGEEVSSRAEIVYNVLHKSQGLTFKKLFDKMRADRFSQEEVRNCLASLEKQQKVLLTGKTWKVIK